MHDSLDEPRTLDTRESGKERCVKFLVSTAIAIAVNSAQK